MPSGEQGVVGKTTRETPEQHGPPHSTTRTCPVHKRVVLCKVSVPIIPLGLKPCKQIPAIVPAPLYLPESPISNYMNACDDSVQLCGCITGK